MREKLQLHIPEPCREDWNQMTPVEQGRFCTSCQKKVVDFVSKTDEEILDFFKNYHGSVCGSFSDDQLQRPIEVIELKQSSSFIKYAASLLLPAVMIGNKLSAQKNNVKEIEEIIVSGYRKTLGKVMSNKICAVPMMKKGDSLLIPRDIEVKKNDLTKILSGRVGGVSVHHSKSDIIKFKGRVVDANTKYPLANASIIIKGTNTGSVSDENGDFFINLPSRSSSLEISTIGYEKKELKYSSIKSDAEAIVEMKPSSVGLLGEVIVVGYTRKLGGATKGVFITYEKSTHWRKLKDTIFPPKVKIYPNPVSSSSTVNLLFPNVKEGLYQVRILNAAGQLFYSVQKQISGKNETEQIHLNSQMTPGVYLVQIIDAQKKLLQTSQLIVQ